MKIITVGYAYCVPENRVLWRRLADLYPNISVTVVPPAEWSTNDYGPHITYTSKLERHNNYEVLPLHFAGKHFERYAGLASLLRAQQPDILCVAQERYSWSTLFALIACRLVALRARTVTYTLTNIEYKLTHLRHRLKEELFFNLSDMILASDAAALAILRAHGYRGTAHNIYPLGAVDAEAIDAHRIERAPASTIYIGFAGTLNQLKGVDDLLRASAQLNGEWHLHIIGDGPERTNLEALALALGVARRVTFAGYVPRHKMLAEMQKLDVLVLPSRTTTTGREQFGVVLVEAMLSGVVVVGSTSGAIPEVIGEAGLIFPEGDFAALAQALQCLIDDPSMQIRLAEQGRERAMSHYSAATMARHLYELCCALQGSG